MLDLSDEGWLSTNATFQRLELRCQLRRLDPARIAGTGRPLLWFQSRPNQAPPFSFLSSKPGWSRGRLGAGPLASDLYVHEHTLHKLCAIAHKPAYIVYTVYGTHIHIKTITPMIQSLYVHTLQRQNTEISKQIFPEKECRGLGPNFHIHASVSDLYIPSHDRSAYSAGGNM
jgi:hypothetical protein